MKAFIEVLHNIKQLSVKVFWGECNFRQVQAVTFCSTTSCVTLNVITDTNGSRSLFYFSFPKVVKFDEGKHENKQLDFFFDAKSNNLSFNIPFIDYVKNSESKNINHLPSDITIKCDNCGSLLSSVMRPIKQARCLPTGLFDPVSLPVSLITSYSLTVTIVNFVVDGRDSLLL